MSNSSLQGTLGMADYIEIDFLDVESGKSGDAITIRYSVGGVVGVHVVDGGYVDTGEKIIGHIESHYSATHIDNVILTHTDSDHANGLRKVLEECSVGTLWMNRPWIHASEIIERFSTYNSVAALERKLRSVYESASILEEIALRRGIDIKSPFQGCKIGPFDVLAPSKSRYLDLIVSSDRTPEHLVEASLESIIKELLRSTKGVVAAAWGEEYFPEDGTSNENEMSVVQYACINDKKIVLTGDAGREGLSEAADHSSAVGLVLPGVHLFQVPHHGGRRNVSTELLDRWLGARFAVAPGEPTWSAICSSAKADEDHPKKSVIRAMLHRGAHFSSTEGKGVCWAEGIERAGWGPIPQTPYPNEQEG